MINSCISTHFALKEFKKEKHLTVYSSDFCPLHSFSLISPPCRLFEILQHFATCTHMQSVHALLPDLSAAPSPPPSGDSFQLSLHFLRKPNRSSLSHFPSVPSFRSPLLHLPQLPFSSSCHSYQTCYMKLHVSPFFLVSLSCPLQPFFPVVTPQINNTANVNTSSPVFLLLTIFLASSTCHCSFPKAHVTTGGVRGFFSSNEIHIKWQKWVLDRSSVIKHNWVLL